MKRNCKEEDIMEEANIGKLLPVDGFTLNVPQSMPMDVSKALSHLYQPIIGVSAVSLYQTLLSEYDLQQPGDRVRTHHLLMNYLHMPLDDIYDARKKLEAIGLMRTFASYEQGQTVYAYVLIKPFTPNEFFEDDMLSLLLYHHLGQDKYDRLRNAFYMATKIDKDAKEVTSSFEQVFSMHHLTSEKPPDGLHRHGEENVISTGAQGVNVQEEVVDYEWLYKSLQERMLPAQEILSQKHRKVITQLSLLYNLATYELEKAILWSMNDQNELILSELKEACHDLYQNKPSASKGNENKSVTDQRERLSVSDQSNQSETNKASNKEEALIQQLQQISPRELLSDLSEGAEPPEKDIKMIRDIMTQQGLSPGVMNVLIYYVLLKTDMKLSKPYMETIAGHWARLQIKTVSQAMDVAKKENKKYQQWATKKKSGYRKPQKQEVLPDWFKDQKAEEEKKSQSNPTEEKDQEKSPEEIQKEKEDILKAIKNRSKKRTRNNEL